MITDDNGRIREFEENLNIQEAILLRWVFTYSSWPVLRDALIKLKTSRHVISGKHIIPLLPSRTSVSLHIEYNGYWKDVGTLGAYWEANMELIDLIPVFNLYEEYWKIYTKSDKIPPQFIAEEASIDRAIIGEASEIYGEVSNSVIGSGVYIAPGAVVRDSIIMGSSYIDEGTVIDKSIIAESVKVGKNCKLGVGEEKPNNYKPDVYAFGLCTIGDDSVIPDGVSIGKNTAISGKTELSGIIRTDY